jgi:hypothetical protein
MKKSLFAGCFLFVLAGMIFWTGCKNPADDTIEPIDSLYSDKSLHYIPQTDN